MTPDEVRAAVESEYKRRYPNWTDIRVSDVVRDVFGGDIVVVYAKTPSENEEICFRDHKTGIRIFATTEELAFLKDKARSTRLEESRQTINRVVALGGLLVVVLFALILWYQGDPRIVTKNLAAIAGLPFSFIAAFTVVALFRQSETPLDFSGFGLTMKGAAGEIVLWVICYLAISGSLAWLWKLA
jgi:hypothetical protein